MKKAFLLLTLVLLATVGFAQMKTITIPVKYTTITVPTTEVLEKTTTDTTVHQHVFYIDSLVHSVVVKKRYGTDIENNAYTELVLQDGHVERFSVVNNYTLSTDIIGSEYSYYLKVRKQYNRYSSTTVTTYDTIHSLKNEPHTVNLICLRQRAEYWYDNGYNLRRINYYTKIYSYSTGKSYWIETSKDFYEKYNKVLHTQKRLTRKQKINSQHLLLYKDYKCLKNNSFNLLFDKKYIYEEIVN